MNKYMFDLLLWSSDLMMYIFFMLQATELKSLW